MDVDVAAQTSILRRALLCPQRPHDRFVLRFGYQAISQTAFGVRGIRVTDTERKIEGTLVILSEDVEVTFRSAPISLPHFVADGVQAEADLICAYQLVCGKQEQLPLSFLDDDPWFHERQLQWRTIAGVSYRKRP